MNENLTYEMRNSLLLRHKTERDGRIKDRIKAVLLFDDGWTYCAIAKALFISEDSVLRHILDYKRSEKLKPQNGGSDAKLDVVQCRELLAHLEEKTYLYVKEIVAYVFEKYKLKYRISGMTSWLHTHNFSYHKPAVTPAKADKKRQEDFIKFYENLKKTLPNMMTVMLQLKHQRILEYQHLLFLFIHFLPASTVSSTLIRHANSSTLNTDQSNATCQLPNTKGNKAISPVTMI